MSVPMRGVRSSSAIFCWLSVKIIGGLEASISDGTPYVNSQLNFKIRSNKKGGLQRNNLRCAGNGPFIRQMPVSHSYRRCCVCRICAQSDPCACRSRRCTGYGSRFRGQAHHRSLERRFRRSRRQQAADYRKFRHGSLASVCSDRD